MLKSSYNGKEFSQEEAFKMVGPGWKPILEDLFQKLFALGWDGSVAQIKEKFGTLRAYLDGISTDEMEELIQEAENLSAKTCESCGAPGERHPGWGWMRTECHECNEKRIVAEGRPPFGDQS